MCYSFAISEIAKKAIYWHKKTAGHHCWAEKVITIKIQVSLRYRLAAEWPVGL